MPTWVLLIWFLQGSSAGVMAQVDGYKTDAECRAAGAVAEAQAKSLSWYRAQTMCIPGPQR